MSKHILKKKLAGLIMSKSGELMPVYRYTWFDSKGRLIAESVNINMIDRDVRKYILVDEEINYISQR